MKTQSSRVRLTAGRVESFTCPTGKPQAFLWDTDAPTLAVRVTPTGRKTYVFESRLSGSTIRINIGTVTDWPIEKARTRAQGLKMLVDAGTDPRETERQQQAAQAATKAAAALHAVTTGEAWAVYLAERKDKLGDRHHNEHLLLVKPGGAVTNRTFSCVTKPVRLHSFLAMPLLYLTAPRLDS